MQHGTLGPSLIRPWAVPRIVVDVTLVVAGSLLTAALAQLAVRLPFTPVPVTGQTLGVLLVGAALGARRGAASMALYLAEGAAGLPVFAGGTAGPLVLLGPTSGYLFGFVPAAFVVGLLAERGLDRRLPGAILAFAAGTAVIFVCGLGRLAGVVGPEAVLAAGLWPFLPGAAIKIALAASLLPATWKLVGDRDRV